MDVANNEVFIVGTTLFKDYQEAKKTALRDLITLIKSGKNDEKLDNVLSDYYKQVIYPAKITSTYSSRKSYNEAKDKVA